MSELFRPSSRLILLGAGGHAKVLHALALSLGHDLFGVCDPDLASRGVREWRGLPILGDDAVLKSLDPGKFGIINGIGSIAGSTTRQDVYDRVRKLGFGFPALVHPTAWVADDATLGDGVQVMAGAIVQPDCSIGVNSIVNTRASIDHDCHLGAHVHIAPGATLCGGVLIGDGTFIGAGAIVIQGISIGSCATVGAGTTLVKSLQDMEKALGGGKHLVGGRVVHGTDGRK